MGAVMIWMWNISIQVSVIFGVLLAVRGLFSLCRVPKKYAYGLWAILFIRLLIPVQPETAFGLMPRNSWAPEWVRQREGQIVSAEDFGVRNKAYDAENDPGAVGGAPSPGNPPGMGDGAYHKMNAGEAGDDAASPGSLSAPQGGTDRAGDLTGTHSGTEGGARTLENSSAARGGVYHKIDAAEDAGDGAVGSNSLRASCIVIPVWAAGAAGVFLYSVFSYIRLKKKIRCCICLETEAGTFTEGGRQEKQAPKARQQSRRIYLADDIDMPFVLGIFSPRIYLPSSLEEKNLRYVIAHEQIHIRRGDYLVKLAAFLIAGFYWYLPAAWLGFLFMGRDMEMSCDEAVMQRLGEENRGAYADSLLLLTCGKRYSAVMPPTFSEGNPEGRIRHIMKYKKPVTAAAALGVVLIAVLAAGFLTSRRETAEERGPGAGAEVIGTSAERKSGAGAEVIGTSAERKSGAGAEVIGTSAERKPGAGAEVIGTSEERNSGTGSGGNGNPAGKKAGEDAKAQVIATLVIQKTDILPSAQPVEEFRSVGEVILDYADDHMIVFRGGFGPGSCLYIYRSEEERVVGALDLETVGRAGMTGENIDIGAAADGSKLYIHPKGQESKETVKSADGTETVVVGDVGYIYDMSTGELAQVSYSVLEAEGGMPFPESVFTELANPAELADIRETALLDQPGALSRRCATFEENGSRMYGYLASADGTVGSLVYVKGRRSVRLFYGGTTSNSASYGDSTIITVGETTYDLAEHNDMVNAVVSLRYAGGLWIAEGHINPDMACYSIYDTRKETWEKDILCSHLVWDTQAGAGQEIDIRDTMVYDLYHEIYNYKGKWIGKVATEEGEYIAGLVREGDEVIALICSALREESYRREARIFVPGA